MVLLFLGPSGSGKDTQADILSKNFNFIVLGTGDMFRSEIESGSSLAKELQSYINHGLWVPNEIWQEIVRKNLSFVDWSKNVILNAFVREKEQTRMLDEILANLGTKIDKVIQFKIERESLIKRLSNRMVCPKCLSEYNILYNPPKVKGICDNDGERLKERDDDSMEGMNKRFDNYFSNIDFILDYYKSQKILFTINADQSISEVANDINKLLKLK